MGRTYDRLTEPLRAFVAEQHLFFVATAPLAADGHVNLSPKGYDTLRVLDDQTVCYLDVSGSGAETMAHVRENGRITLMCCAFDGPANVVRMYGEGEVVGIDDPRFEELVALFPPRSGVRAVILVRIGRVSTSCGYAVPFMAYVGERERLEEVFAAKSPDEVRDYWRAKNTVSIDGLPAMDVP
jgi:hypothetical protein